MVADSEDAVNELDEENNRVELVLRVRTTSEASSDAPNLTVLSSNIRFFPAVPRPGAPVTITAVVRNQGETVADNVVVRFEDVTDEGEEEDVVVVIGEFTIAEPIQPGARELAVISFETSDLDGPRVIRVTADPDNEISETDEDDNSAERTLRFSTSAQGNSQGAGSDSLASSTDVESREESANLALNAQEVEVEVARAGEGDLVVVATKVRNDGSMDAGGFSIQVLDESDDLNPLGSPQTVEYLAAGEEVTVRTVFRAADGLGTRTLQVVVDPANVISESSELDNRVSVLVSALTPADG